MIIIIKESIDAVYVSVLFYRQFLVDYDTKLELDNDGIMDEEEYN